MRWTAAVLALGVATTAQAQDDLPRLMAEPTSFTDAIDSFDEGDPFDATLGVGFRRRRTAGTIQRQPGAAPGSGRGSANWTDIGDWEHTRNELVINAQVGIFRDVMLYGELPLILSDSREILYPGSTSTGDVDLRLQESLVGGGDPQLFYMPFQSPTRSGLDTLTVGLAFDILNQFRRPAFPTWMMLFEFQLGVGELIQPCERNGLLRDPQTGVPTSTEPVDCETGLSRGTHAIRFESRVSRRYRYAEAYSGLLFHFEWAGRADSKFTPSGNLSGFRNTRPPIRGSLTAGVAFIPWENREAWQRFTVDVRVHGTYVSEGRDYSPLFDALGSSQHPTLTIDNLEGNPGTGRPGSLRRVPFTGLTDVQAHGELGGQLAIEMRAARYVRFRFGVDLQYITPHVLTFSDGCNPGPSPSGPDDSRACDPARPDDGLINPHHRPVIDRTGNRFRLDGALDLTLFVGAAAQF
ncbi:MAG: hypothetical protein AAGE52_02965 [Myxococcota bacterium]